MVVLVVAIVAIVLTVLVVEAAVTPSVSASVVVLGFIAVVVAVCFLSFDVFLVTGTSILFLLYSITLNDRSLSKLGTWTSGFAFPRKYALY